VQAPRGSQRSSRERAFAHAPAAAKYEHVATIRKGAVPPKNSNQAGDGHAGLDQEVLKDVGCRDRNRAAANDQERHRNGAKEIDRNEDCTELSHEAPGVAIGGEQFEVDEAKEEDAIKDTERERQAGGEVESYICESRGSMKVSPKLRVPLKLTADPLTPFATKNAAIFAQDDTSF
jgi:hypothetical protein